MSWNEAVLLLSLTELLVLNGLNHYTNTLHECEQNTRKYSWKHIKKIIVANTFSFIDAIC
jgi:hypothetical protein